MLAFTGGRRKQTRVKVRTGRVCAGVRCRPLLRVGGGGIPCCHLPKSKSYRLPRCSLASVDSRQSTPPSSAASSLRLPLQPLRGLTTGFRWFPRHSVWWCCLRRQVATCLVPLQATKFTHLSCGSSGPLAQDRFGMVCVFAIVAGVVFGVRRVLCIVCLFQFYRPCR